MRTQIIYCLFALFCTSVSAQAGQLKVIESQADSQVLMVVGIIDDELVRHFSMPESYISNFDASKKTTLVFDNPGGYTAYGYGLSNNMIEFAEKIYSNSRSPLDFVILYQCDSMCILTFAIFADRARGKDYLKIRISAEARFGFHGVSNNYGWNYAQSDLYFRILSIYGSAEWAEKNARFFMTTNLSYKTAKELFDENSGIVKAEDLQYPKK